MSGRREENGLPLVSRVSPHGSNLVVPPQQAQTRRLPFGSELGPDLSQMAPNELAPRSPARKKKIRIMGALLEDGVSRLGALPEQPHLLESETAPDLTAALEARHARILVVNGQRVSHLDRAMR